MELNMQKLLKKYVKKYFLNYKPGPSGLDLSKFMPDNLMA
jgi:hypothetical protein